MITPGEPAGIGPDLVVTLAQKSWTSQLLVVADPDLLMQRAAQLNLPLTLQEFNPENSAPQKPGHLTILPEKLNTPCTAGKLEVNNAEYVLRTLRTATDLCLNHTADALVTGPVHKGIINQADFPFSGHTEFLAHLCQKEQVVMLLATEKFRVALVTTHLPLRQVAENIHADKIKRIIPILVQGLKRHFHIEQPHIFVAGLNPHAGEGGHLGHEEITEIIPALNSLRALGFQLTGPLSADTMFNPENLSKADAFLCMYHDQGLPVLKYAGFGNAANITLGLPFLRTSVDHGTALELAGTGKAKADSFEYALLQALKVQTQKIKSAAVL